MAKQRAYVNVGRGGHPRANWWKQQLGTDYYSSVSGGGEEPTFDPLSLDPVLWIDAIGGEYVSTVDNNGTRARGNIIDSATAKTEQSLANAGTLASKGIFNGEGWWMKGGAQMTTGAVSDYGFIHDGSDFEIWYTFKELNAGAGAIRSLLQNNGFSNTAKGILLYYDNTGSAHILKLRIGNGTSAVISLDMSGAITADATNTIRIKKSGNVVTVFVNGVQKGTQTASLSFVSGDTTSALTVCGITAATTTVYLKDVFIIDRVLTDDELTSMSARTFASITPTAINTDTIIGDSNAVGQAPNSGIASDLTGEHDTLIFKMATGAVAGSDYIEKLELGVNQVRGNQNLSLHGIEMRLGESFSNVNLTRSLFKYAEGSTDANAWTSGQLTYTRAIASIPQFIDDLVHGHRRLPVLRSIVIVHGANDVQTGDGANYQEDITDLIKAIIDTFNASTLGATVKARLVIFRSKTGTSGYEATAGGLVRAAQEAMGEGSVLTDYPALSSYLLGATWFDTDSADTVDGTHYDDAAYEVMAGQAYDYLVPFENE